MKDSIEISSIISSLGENDRKKVLFHEERIKALEKTTFLSVCEMGSHLYELKQLFRNKKEYDQYVDETFGFKSRTAYNMISLWFVVKKYSSLQSLGKDALYFIASGSFPKQLLPLLNDTKGEIPFKKKDLMVIKEQFEKGKFDVLSDSIKNSYQKTRQRHFCKIWMERGKHLIKVLENEIDGLESTINNQRNFLGAEAVNGESYEIITKILARAAAEIEDHLNEKSGRLKNAEKADLENAIIGDISIDGNNKPLDDEKIADLLELTPQPSPDNQSEMVELVDDNGLTVTNDAVAPVEALAQLELGPDNDALFTNIDDVIQDNVDDGLSADRVEKLSAVTDATPSPTAFDREYRGVGGTDETTPVATEDHEYSAASDVDLFKGVVEAVPVVGRNDEKSYAVDDEGFFTGHDDMPPSDIIDIDAGDDETLEEKEKEAEETSGAF